MKAKIKGDIKPPRGTAGANSSFHIDLEAEIPDAFAEASLRTDRMVVRLAGIANELGALTDVFRIGLALIAKENAEQSLKRIVRWIAEEETTNELLEAIEHEAKRGLAADDRRGGQPNEDGERDGS